MRYKIHHKTTYEYSSNVSYSHHLAKLKPRNSQTQKVLSSSLKISPHPETVSGYSDYFGNETSYFSLIAPHDTLVIESSSEILISPAETISLDLAPPWEDIAKSIKFPNSPECLKAAEYSFASDHCPLSPAIREYALKSFTPNAPLLEAALNLNRQIHEEFTFDPTATTLTTSVEEVFEKKAGVCQDFAHFQISALRSLGLAARYVSGYIRTEPPKGKPRLIGADASHAWISLYIPRLGWIDYDSTNNLIPSTDHIFVAYGRDYNDICPVRGIVYGGGSQNLKVGVTVTPQD